MTRQQVASLIVLVTALISGAGFGCQEQSSADAVAASAPITLKVWGIWDNPDDVQPVFDDFRSKFSHVTVEYRKLRYEEYEQAILEAIANGEGPDVIALHSTWLGRYKTRVLPAPTSVKLPVQVSTGTNPSSGAQTKIVKLQTFPIVQPKDVRTLYTDVVASDVVLDEKVYGVPLTFDSLVLYYNKQLLNAAGIPEPPKTWEQFKQQVQKLTLLGPTGDVVQAGAALGTAKNVPRSTDILSLLMLQNGTKMTNASKTAATFNLPVGESGSFIPGLDALRFYTDFALPTKEVYTWNEKMPDALTAFTSGKLAFFFGYSYNAPTLRTQAPQLDWGVTKVPQIQETGAATNFANYWVYSVTTQSKHPEEAWALVNSMTQQSVVDAYSTQAEKPAALRALISKQSEDEKIGVFASQVLTAKNWYSGKDIFTAESALQDAITNTITGALPYDQALKRAAEQVNTTL